ncbi:hypothetical protein AMJ80_02395 [bacterium SM23_31]|nr:MAG: hypothetical protein AMJ80_02395 [bacterium SM23_31]
MMNFRLIHDSIINILGLAEAGRFQTIGFQRQTKAVEEAVDNSRMVTVFYSAGNFPKTSAGLTGPVQHDITFRVELLVAKPATADIATINNPASTPAQKLAALAALQEAAQRADGSMDELIEIVYQILMDARNVDMGLPVGTVASRWIPSFQKDEPRPKGDLVQLTAAATLTLRTAEQIAGDPGVEGANIINNTLDIPGNTENITGVLIDNA